jgi:hypothetical protein
VACNFALFNFALLYFAVWRVISHCVISRCGVCVTAGLDGRAATLVMRAVRNTVDTGRTVVCTIHQPNKAIFGAFDELLLLKVRRLWS